MNRIPRIFAVVVCSFVLVATTLPAAHAGTLAKFQLSHPALSSSWLNATLSWISSFVQGTHPMKPSPSAEKWTPPFPNPPGGILAPMTGACIDPNGCLIGGGGPG